MRSSTVGDFRLTPAPAATIGLAGLLTHWTRDSFRSFLLQAAQAATYTLNIGHTFSSHPGDQVLSHTWSLGVEEQFYLLWAPVSALLLAAVATRHRRLAVLAAVVLALFASGMFTAALVDPKATFFLPWARLPELLVGAIVAVLLHPSSNGPIAKFLASPFAALVASAVLVVLTVTVKDLVVTPGCTVASWERR